MKIFLQVSKFKFRIELNSDDYFKDDFIVRFLKTADIFV